MPRGKPEEWSHAGHSLLITSWYPRSEMAITPAWYQGFIDGVSKVEGADIEEVKIELKAIIAKYFTESGEFGQEEF